LNSLWLVKDQLRYYLDMRIQKSIIELSLMHLVSFILVWWMVRLCLLMMILM